jgi:hypothetical protein
MTALDVVVRHGVDPLLLLALLWLGSALIGAIR